jgi:hypothetical protein
MNAEKPKRRPKTKRRVQAVTPQMIDTARTKLCAWSPSGTTQISVLRSLKNEIEVMLAKGAKQRDVMNELWALGFDLSHAVFREYFRERNGSST